jgi:hypothetical protein
MESKYSTSGIETAENIDAGVEIDQGAECTRLPAHGIDQQIFPCRSNEEVRTALEKLLQPVRIEVAGGIVRHNVSW